MLVVDDEPQIRSLVKTLLSEEGLPSVEAGDGYSALAVARTLDGEIGLLLTDIDLAHSTVRNERAWTLLGL